MTNDFSFVKKDFLEEIKSFYRESGAFKKYLLEIERNNSNQFFKYPYTLQNLD